MAPGAPGGQAGQTQRPIGHGYLPPRQGNSGDISVRPFAGYGVRAEFDPATGALRAASPGSAGLGGVYGDLGGVQVVFYRDRAGLTLRVGDRMIELDDGPIAAEHGPIDPRHNRFAVVADGTTLCELFYRSLPREMDLGAHVADVLADPRLRADIYAH